jgi:hypothetical protein
VNESRFFQKSSFWTILSQYNLTTNRYNKSWETSNILHINDSVLDFYFSGLNSIQNIQNEKLPSFINKNNKSLTHCHPHVSLPLEERARFDKDCDYYKPFLISSYLPRQSQLNSCSFFISYLHSLDLKAQSCFPMNEWMNEW